MRSGQQAALGSDVIELMDALNIEKAILGGFDWGGMSCCVAAALWPERVAGLVSYASYDIADISASQIPNEPALECSFWYQHFFQQDRGEKCLAENRRSLCRMLWEQWSPTFSFSEDFYNRTAESFDNPDFVDVVIHAYRFCFGNAKGDPRLQKFEDVLGTKPKIMVPTVALDGLRDPLKRGGTASHREQFGGMFERREVDVGHAFPMEAPDEFANAVLTVHEWLAE